jgi:hypothetical protein
MPPLMVSGQRALWVHSRSLACSRRVAAAGFYSGLSATGFEPAVGLVGVHSTDGQFRTALGIALRRVVSDAEVHLGTTSGHPRNRNLLAFRPLP